MHSPRLATWSRTAGPSLTSRTALITFDADKLKKVPSSVRILGVPCKVSPRHRTPKVVQCDSCLGYHAPKECGRPRRCMKCSSTSHPTEEHTSAPPACGATREACACPARCANC